MKDFNMVRSRRLELPRVAPLPPQGTSTMPATSVFNALWAPFDLLWAIMAASIARLSPNCDSRLARPVLLMTALTLAGCDRPAADSTTPTTNPDFTVDFLFTHDGCRVNRFIDGGRRIYFVTCPPGHRQAGAMEQLGPDADELIGHVRAIERLVGEGASTTLIVLMPERTIVLSNGGLDQVSEALDQARQRQVLQ